jgi:mutator family transposase
LIDDIVREDARRMLAEALQAEVEAYVGQFVAERDEAGRRLVVRNGSHQPREVLTSAGAVAVTAPRVNDRRVDPDTGERQRFSSAILPAWCRKGTVPSGRRNDHRSSHCPGVPSRTAAEFSVSNHEHTKTSSRLVSHREQVIAHSTSCCLLV